MIDSSVIKFGSDQEILLTHDFDKGLTLKHDHQVMTNFQLLLLAVTQIFVDDVIGGIDFVLPDEGTGTDQLTGGSIRVVSEGDFSDNNSIKNEFYVGVLSGHLRLCL